MNDQPCLEIHPLAPGLLRGLATASAGGAGAADLHPLCAGLAARTGHAAQWNFHESLVSREGTRVSSHPSAIDRKDPEVVREISRPIDIK